MPATALLDAGHRAERPFSPVRWFAALGLLCIALTTLGAASLLTRFYGGSVLRHDVQVSADLIGGIVRAGRFWPYFEDHATPEARAGLEDFFNHVSTMPDVMRANVYGADGEVLWSSDRGLIGRQLGPNGELARALAGGIQVESGVAGGPAKTEHATFGAAARGTRFVEAYLPVRDRTGGRVIGVVEIYRQPASLFRMIDEGERTVWAGALGCAALLYGALFWVVRRADQRVRRQAERLSDAEALATVGVFASAVAHGIRNPLAAIRSSAELIRDDRDEAARQEMLAELLQQADLVEGWLRDLLLSARGEAMASGAVDVAALLRESARGFAATAEQRSVRLSLRAGPTPPARGEAGPLARVIDNLIANAIEAMPGGGVLSIESGVARDGSAVEIRVADTGTGMPPAVAARVARPFFSTKPRGTGLGLALARQVLAGYAGTLALDTAEGRGTTVTIRLPALAA